MRGLQEVKGKSPKPSSRDQKKTMKTNKQNKTNKTADKAQVGSTNIGGRTSLVELKNRTEQLSETETTKSPETAHLENTLDALIAKKRGAYIPGSYTCYLSRQVMRALSKS
jgi:hypothetical protein